MDRQQIDALHEQASERYLSGAYADALSAWRQIIEVEPQDERALEGIRLCELLVDGSTTPPAQAPPQGDGLDFDLGLDDAALSAGASAEAIADIGDALDELPSESPIEERLDLARSHFAAGRMPAAAELCREVLQLVPGHPRASELLDQCSIDVVGDDEELEFELSALDSLSADPPPPPAPAPDPEHEAEVAGQTRDARQNDGLDFGDIEETETLSLAAEVPLDQPKRGLDGLAEAVQVDEELAPEAFETPLPELDADPQAEAAADPGVPDEPDSAEEELRRRVDDLLEQARKLAAEDNADEALAVLQRVGILDEGNEEAIALEAELRGSEDATLQEVENCLIEGVQAFENGDFDQARQWFGRALEAFPGHQEAEHYLEKIAEAEAEPSPDAAEEDLLGSPPPDESAGHHEPADLEAETEAIPLEVGGQADPFAAELAHAPAPDVPTRATRPSSAAPSASPGSGKRWVLIAVVVAALGGAGYWLYPKFMGGDDPQDARELAAQRQRSADEATAAATGAGAAPQPALTDAERAEQIYALLEQARAHFEAGRYAEAVVAYNAVAGADPENLEAHEGLKEAGERYKAQKELQKQVERASRRFEQGSYAQALRMIYRLPEGLDPALVARYKVNGWFNLGLVSLKAGRCEEALEHFTEALALAPEDPTLLRAADLAERHIGVAKRGDYYRAVDGMAFRALQD